MNSFLVFNCCWVQLSSITIDFLCAKIYDSRKVSQFPESGPWICAVLELIHLPKCIIANQNMWPSPQTALRASMFVFVFHSLTNSFIRVHVNSLCIPFSYSFWWFRLMYHKMKNDCENKSKYSFGKWVEKEACWLCWKLIFWFCPTIIIGLKHDKLCWLFVEFLKIIIPILV